MRPPAASAGGQPARQQAKPSAAGAHPWRSARSLSDLWRRRRPSQTRRLRIARAPPRSLPRGPGRKPAPTDGRRKVPSCKLQLQMIRNRLSALCCGTDQNRRERLKPLWTAQPPTPNRLTERTVRAARAHPQRPAAAASRGYLAFAGPAIIASIAYMDPGNFATNIQAGAKYGYSLLWVVLLANVIAMLFQALSAKLGIVTGRNLAEMCREQFPKPVVLGDVGGERNRRHGHRPRRIPRRRHRPGAACSTCRCSPAWRSPRSSPTAS